MTILMKGYNIIQTEDWNNTAERIKFRLLAQKKLQLCSKQIEDNMKNNNLKIGRNHGQSYDL